MHICMLTSLPRLPHTSVSSQRLMVLHIFTSKSFLVSEREQWLLLKHKSERYTVSFCFCFLKLD